MMQERIPSGFFIALSAEYLAACGEDEGAH